MKHLNLKVILLLAISFSIAGVVLSRTGTAPAGRTGAPSEGHCFGSGCHNGSAYVPDSSNLLITVIGSSGTSVLTDGWEYTPGAQYIFDVGVLSGNVKGMQFTTLDSNNTFAGSYEITDASRTQIQTAGSRTYVGHKNANSNANFSFKWNAPSSGTGSVTAYVAVNAANGNGSDNGDSIYEAHFKMAEFNVNAIKEVENPLTMSIYPNPVLSKEIFVEFNSIHHKDAVASIYTLDGKLKERFLLGTSYTNQAAVKLNLSETYDEGIYLFELQEGNIRSINKLLILP